MTPETHPRRRARALLADNAPVAFLLGLVIVGVSLLLLGVLASEGTTTPLDDTLVHARNGTITSSHPVPPYAPRDAVLEVEYAFPDAPGDVYLVNCVDHARLLDGLPVVGPAVHHADVREGAFTRAMDSYLGHGTTIFYFPESGTASPSGSTSSGAGAGTGASSGTPATDRAYCTGAFVAFQWSAAASESSRPHVMVQVREVPLDSGTATALFALTALGGLLALAGGVEWGRQRGASATRAPDPGSGLAETLYRLAERSEAWLTRTRRYVLISGPLGIFLWYPVLIPWAWRAGRAGSRVEWMPWVLAGGVLVFLGGLTILWAREFLRLDRELAAWRRQLAELRRREEDLLAEFAD